MQFDKQDQVVPAPDALHHPPYHLTNAAVKAAKLKQSLVGSKEEVLAKAAKINAKNRHFIMPHCNTSFPAASLHLRRSCG
jgi:hypothetical protein